MYLACLEKNEKRNGKNRNNKLKKKVSNFRDKSGEIKKEVQLCKMWINALDKNKIRKECYEVLKENCYECKKMDIDKFNLEIYHKLKHSINKNHYYLAKKYKEYGFSVYQKEDICIFLLILLESLKRNMLDFFLDIPDVFYILRQIKGVGLNYYFYA